MNIRSSLEQERGSNLRGNEDVFLSLAHNDDSGEHDNFEDARESHDDWKVHVPKIPGQFPSISPRIPSTRPHSGGHALARRNNDLLMNAFDSNHTRHSSQPELSPTLSIGAFQPLERDTMISRLGTRSPKPELQARTRLERMRIFDGTSDSPKYERVRPSYSEHPLATDYRSLRGGGRERFHETGKLGLERHDAQEEGITKALDSRPSPPGSDSMESQTAPSTVWDELDELKSRIKNLEVGGRLPRTSSGNVSGQTADRPRTATTAPTTISSSPRHVRKSVIAPSEVTVGGSPTAGVHALMQSALERARLLLKPHLYRPLESAAADALAMASMVGGAVQQSSTASVVNNGASLSDRQLRRKTDSMCRNITDLCIALCDAQGEETRVQSSPLSARKLQQSTPPSRSARASIVPDDDTLSQAGTERRRASRKSLGRLEDFRSARGLSPLVGGSSPDSYQTAERSPSTTPKDYAARYMAGSRQDERPNHDDSSEMDPNVRAPSRAMTDIGSLRQAPMARRDYLSNGAQRSPSLRETLAARRASASIREEDSVSGAPTPMYLEPDQKRRMIDRGPSSEVGSVTSMSRRRISNIEPYSPAFRLGSTPIRTSSLIQRHMAAES